MKKLIFILLILAQAAALSQWKQYGSVQKVNAHQGNVRDFAISEDSKFIYTVDNNGILKKWDYETGENIFSKQLQQVPGEFIPANWFFLSSDAKTYCIVNFKLKYGNDVSQFLNAYIYDINTYALIDSINYNYLTTNLDKYYSLNCFFADYNFNQKLLILSVNCTTYRGQYATTYTSGITSFLKKDIDSWILNKKIFEYIDYWYKDSNLLFISSHNSNSYILGGDYSSEYRNSNVIYNLTDDKSQAVFSYYIKDEQPYGGKHESGRELNIKSAFFSIDKLDLFCSINDTLFRYNMNTLKLDSTRLVNDKSGKEIRIFNLPDNNLFVSAQGNTISIYNSGTLDFLDQVSLPDIESINLLKYSTDGKHIVFADGEYLCKIYTSSISKLRANFFCSDTISMVGKEITFLERSIGYPDSYLWDFGDGETSTEQNPVHIYNKKGYYNVKLIVSKNGSKDSVTKMSYVYVVNKLIADFDYTLSGSETVTANFKNKSTGSIDSLRWSFDDGTYSIITNPEHKYTISGQYYVTLIEYSNIFSDTCSKILTIQIPEKAINNDKIGWDYSDTVKFNGIAIKGWEEKDKSIIYHIMDDSVQYHHGAFLNSKNLWNETKKINKEFLVRRDDGVFCYISDTAFQNIDKSGTELKKAYNVNIKNLYSVESSENNISAGFKNVSKYTVQEISENFENKFSKDLDFIDYYYDYKVKFDLYNFLFIKKGKYFDYIINNHIISKPNYPPYNYEAFALTINGIFLPFRVINDFIRLNESTTVMVSQDSLFINKNRSLKVDSTYSKPPDIKLFAVSDLQDYNLYCLLKLNDTCFVAAGDLNSYPAYVVFNTNGKILDSVTINERTGSFRYISITPDYQLLLSGYRAKYNKIKTPYFVKSNDSFVKGIVWNGNPDDTSDNDSIPNQFLTNLKAVPNPANNSTIIEFLLSGSSTIRFKLYNTLGEVVYSEPAKEYNQGYNSIPINLSRLPIGSYYYVLEANGQVYSGKIAYARE